jgi:hypothetical protein
MSVTEETKPSLTDAQLKSYVEICSKAVDTQMRFNEMSAKSRQLGLTFVAGALGVGIVLLSRGSDFSITIPMPGWRIQFDLHVSVLILVAAALALFAVSILDLKVYHKMLRPWVAVRGAPIVGRNIGPIFSEVAFDVYVTGINWPDHCRDDNCE